MAKKAARESYGAALVKYGENPNMLCLSPIFQKSTKTEMFKKVYPERFINMGIAESNMMCVAVGLAASGKSLFRQHLQCLPQARAFEQKTQSHLPTKQY